MKKHRRAQAYAIIHRKEPLPMLLFTRVYGYYYGCAYGYQVRLAS